MKKTISLSEEDINLLQTSLDELREVLKFDPDVYASSDAEAKEISGKIDVLAKRFKDLE